MCEHIETYRLTSNTGLPLRFASDHWRCEGIYLSDTCLAAHLILGFGQTAEAAPGASRDALKEDLRAILRALGHMALREDLWRPVVGVIEADHGALGQLGADQEWHRGDFVVFLEPEFPCKRLEDLLCLGEQLPGLLSERVEDRDSSWFRKQLEGRLAHEQGADEIRTLIDLLLPPPLPEERQSAADESNIEDGFRHWSDDVMDRARAISREGKGG